MKLLAEVGNKLGLVAGETLENDIRIGFDLMDSAGNKASLARTNKQTAFPVGRYFVDIETLDELIKPLFTFGPEQLLYIDEIGQMQLYSSLFKELAISYFDCFFFYDSHSFF